MNYLILYENYNKDNDILHIFDLDDTLVESDSFEEQSISFLKESTTIKSLLNKSVKLIGKTLKDLKWEHGRIYIPDSDNQIEIKGNWVRKKNRVYLITPDKYYFTDLSLPNKTLKLSEKYNSVKNKAIVTGRIKTMKSKIENSMDNLGLDKPNYGLFCFPSKDDNPDRVADWKAKTIVKLIKDTKFKKVIFYEDKSKWLRAVKNLVKKELPDIDFEGIKC